MPHSKPVLVLLFVLAVGCGQRPDSPRDLGRDAELDAGPSAAEDTGVDSGGDVRERDGDDADAFVEEIDAGAAPVGDRFDRLPIEVLGPPGAAASVEIDVSTDMSNGAASLQMTIHNVVASDSAVVWINDHGPIDLDAAEADGGFARRRGGTVTGAVALGAGAVVEGTNVVTFQYTRQVPDVSGFRVLDVAIEVGGESFRGPTAFDDPADWAPFDETAEAIARGERYFGEVSRDGGPVCATCHADSGADLQYYSFSNRSIVERAMFHEFSREDAEDITSYIRSLDVPQDGTVWDPPFQPGPGNFGAAGAGLDAVIRSDETFATQLFGQPELPAVAWDWASAVDTYELPSTVQVPTWFRWLPREIDEEWFAMRDGELAEAEARLAAEPTLENAHAFMSSAVSIGKEIMVLYGDHPGRIELLRFAAVKLWDWSRKHSFYDADHGFPDDEYGTDGQWGSPAYPYEVGFAFFEAASAGHPDAMEQAIEWWVVQMALDPGRGRSNGNRPLDYRDVLLAAESNVGPAELASIYLLGSWEESRGAMRDAWGTPTGPVRLLGVVMPLLSPQDRTTLWLRHLAEEAVRGDAVRSSEHHTMLSNAWSSSCDELSDDQVTRVRAAIPQDLESDFQACP